jgi:PAS domain S-box-containing protein
VVEVRPNFSGTRLRAQDSLPEHLKRIEAYMRGCGLLVHPREPSPLRSELAQFMSERLDDMVDEWVDQLSEAVRIPEDQRHGLRHDIYAATVRWIRHIENPEDVETYHYLQAHARRTFISQHPASRFLASQMKMRAIVVDRIRSAPHGEPERRERLVSLLNQEFQERVLHITDFFVEAREQELQEQEISYRKSIDNAPAVIFRVHYDDGWIVDANLVAEKVVGYGRDELARMRMWDLMPPHERERVQRLFAETRSRGHSNREDLHLVTRQGELVPVLLNAGRFEFGPHRFLQAICVDVSDRKRLESQLIQSEKMAAIGQLAAGIAHEIRNPLGIITNALYDLGEVLEIRSGEVEEDLQIAKEEMARVQAIIENLLEFSRDSRAELEPVDIDELLRRTLQLLGKSLQNSDVRVVTDFGDLPLCHSNQNALRQVFLNLITNAVQAMPSGGELYLRTETLPDQRVRLIFRDTGMGIPEENVPSIFNPFFTTKDPGQGTGLGLSVVHSVIRRLRGEIQVSSRVGQGTTFVIDLPCPCERERVGPAARAG